MTRSPLAQMRDLSAATRHAEEAERLLEDAGKAIFQGSYPMFNTRELALAAANVHASLAVYYTCRAAREDGR